MDVKQHGGKREGAGKKVSSGKYLDRHLKLPPHQENWLKAYRNNTGKPINKFIVEAIERAIAAYEAGYNG